MNAKNLVGRLNLNTLVSAIVLWGEKAYKKTQQGIRPLITAFKKSSCDVLFGSCTAWASPQTGGIEGGI
jgi:hypothetical protein